MHFLVTSVRLLPLLVIADKSRTDCRTHLRFLKKEVWEQWTEPFTLVLAETESIVCTSVCAECKSFVLIPSTSRYEWQILNDEWWLPWQKLRNTSPLLKPLENTLFFSCSVVALCLRQHVTQEKPVPMDDSATLLSDRTKECVCKQWGGKLV